jgi:2,3-bisphosphoglycerate-independent phosphoglycerate mutase
MTDINSHNNSEDVPLRPRPVVLLLLDGWGIAPASDANAIASVKTPAFFSLIKHYPVATLDPQNMSLNDRYFILGSGQSLVEESFRPSVTLSGLISSAGLKQMKITESERLAALTHFFNGRSDNKMAGEESKILSSETNNYAAQSRLTTLRLTREIIKAISGENFDFIVAVIPTLDLAAASGDSEATKTAVMAVDKSLKKIVGSVLDKKGAVVISATGGNAEKIKDLGMDMVDKEMTSNPVPLIIISEGLKGKTIGLAEPLNNDLSLLKPAGTLADLAPTILRIMQLDVPADMTGHSLIN